jgi:hypothetical protein
MRFDRSQIGLGQATEGEGFELLACRMRRVAEGVQVDLAAILHSEPLR